MRRSLLTLMLLVGGCSGDGPKTETPTPEVGVAAFETVRAVLQHPRCQNCHPGGDAPLQGEKGIVHAQFVKRGPEGRGEVGQECTTCHGPANPSSNFGAHIPPGVSEGWHMPKPEMPLVFVGVAPHDLCEQMKDPKRNGGKDMAALRKHLDTPLVLWGWKPGFEREPVSVPYEKFVAAWETWDRAGAPCP
jgi:hypothetical protein